MNRRDHAPGLVTCVVCSMLSLPLAAQETPTVSIQSLLKEMVDRDANARTPMPAYHGKQASSWDRSQLAPGGPDWFGNKDYDHSLRVEQNNGRTEYVIMEDLAPGCVTRIWKPLDIQSGIPKSIVRFYLDGRDEPTLAGDFSELLAGRGLFKAPFSEIASDERDAERQISLPPGVKQFGGNLYFPIPYAKSCKITVEVPDGPDQYGRGVFFYIVNYRTYEPGAVVESFSLSRYEAAARLRERVAKRLATPGEGVKAQRTIRREGVELVAGEKLAIEMPKGARAVRNLRVKVPATIAPEALKNLWVTAAFDGQPSVCCAFTELFGGGFFDRDAHPEAPTEDGSFLRSQWNRNRQVEDDGTHALWYVMPYQREAQIAIHNTGTQPVKLSAEVGVGQWDWDDRSMLFHANWRESETSYDFSDWNYLDAVGQGVYVGDTLSVYNPYKTWYGEGDERVYIDGEKFPSHLGTGTEDYYCYAWGMANHWRGPFFSAPARDSRGKGDWRGYQSASRERLLDGIPFHSSLRIDMEAWNRAGVWYTVGTMWYARPGATLTRRARSTIVTDPVFRGDASAMSSRIYEGESLRIVKVPSGETGVQSSAAWVLGWSGNRQVVWRDAKPGDVLEFEFDVEVAREYAVSLGLTQAADYGVFSFAIDGEYVKGEFDQYSGSTASREQALGRHRLNGGRHTLSVRLVGSNSASNGVSFGLDCFRLATDLSLVHD